VCGEAFVFDGQGRCPISARSVVAGSLAVLAVGLFLVRPATGNEDEYEIGALLDRYQRATRAMSPQEVADCYTPVVEKFYLWRNVPRSEVAGQYAKQFSSYTAVRHFAISHVSFTEPSGKRITASFDVEWNFAGRKPDVRGVREQMVFVQVDGRWRIAAVTDLKAPYRPTARTK
jgi:hypothetical protein